MENFVEQTFDSSQPLYIKGTLHPSNKPDVINLLSWKIFLQVAAMQLREHEREHDTKEREQWQIRIAQTIQTANRLNSSGLWGYQDAPLHPMPDYLALSAPGIWLERLTQILVETFGNAIPAIILKIN